MLLSAEGSLMMRAALILAILAHATADAAQERRRTQRWRRPGRGAAVREKAQERAGPGVLLPFFNPAAATGTATATATTRTLIGWFHPPKTGSSLGTALAHVANRSLPRCGRMSSCRAAGVESHRQSLNTPYVPHHCHGVSDYFMERFPPRKWFRDVQWWPPADEYWGSHEIISAKTFRKFNGAFYGMFRAPKPLILSNYFRMIGEGDPWVCTTHTHTHTRHTIYS